MPLAGHPPAPSRSPSPLVSGFVAIGRIWAVSFLVALALYVATASRGPQWQDSGWQQVRILAGRIEHPLGLALTHPLQFYLGRAAMKALPLEPAFAITLVSSLAAAIAVANTAGTVFLLTRRASAAILAGSALMLSHTFWQHATHTESYALVAALLTTEWFCWAAHATAPRAWLLVAVAAANGLGIANHLLAALATPVDALLLLLAWRRGLLTPRMLGLAAAIWLLGSSPYTGFVAKTALDSGDWGGTLQSAFFGNFASEVLNVRLSARMIALAFGYFIYNFPGLILPLAVFGLSKRGADPTVDLRPFKWLLVTYTVFVARYSITDQYTFFIPVYLLLAIFAGRGIALFAARHSTWWRRLRPLVIITCVWQPLVYAGAAAVLADRSAFPALVGNKPYRNGYQALLLPWGVGQDHAERLNADAARQAGHHGLLLVEDGMMIFSLEYARLLGRLPDGVDLRRFHHDPSEAGLLLDALADSRPVILVPRDRDRPSPPPGGTRWSRFNDIYILQRDANPPNRNDH